ncbi:HAD family hydrolase [Antribacter gilvus]|uniref:HAD family hydrolase n=1 Tax=Antribacter gilvus TaxID=2304675 RepID=UPI000F7B691F|nr:HAD-IIB family hydrolase [Antribacter gilvus]
MSTTSLPKVVATDLDGTLLRDDGTVSPRTRAALAAAEAAGIEVVFVTARPPRTLARLADLVGGHGHAICFGGGAVWDLATGCALESWGFDDDAVRALAAGLRAAMPDVALAVERVDGASFDPHFVVSPSFEEPGMTAERSAALVEETLGGEPVLKLLARSDATDPVRLQELAATVVGDRAHLAYSGAVGLAEIMPPGVTKSAALAGWCARLGVEPADVWAFGDMPVDLPMLEWAGRGVAVANAHPDVLARVRDVVGSNEEDGVAAAIEAALAAR